MAQSPAVNLRRGGSWGGGEGNVFKGRGRGGGGGGGGGGG